MLKEQKPNNSKLHSKRANKRRTSLNNVVQTKGREESKGDKTNASDDGNDDDDDDDETVKAGSESDKDDKDNDDEEELAKIDTEGIESDKGGDEVSESKRESDEEETRQEEEESFDLIPRTPEGKETESDEESEEEETREEEEESFDLIPRTPEDYEDDGNGDEDQGLRINEEERIQEEEEADELYRDIDINQGQGLHVSQDIEDSHVTLTPVQPDGQQESSSVLSFVTSMLNPTSDAGVESIFTTASSLIAPLLITTPIMTPSTIATITTFSDAQSLQQQFQA
nr:hypothetical protein [Tanacetum cinerariifolium]